MNIWCIIPSHGAGQAFIECINSLLTQTVKPTGIIIVDNNIQDGSLDTLLHQHKATHESEMLDNFRLKVVSLRENTGVTGGRNAGINALPQDYDYACFVDHDMTATPTMLEELLKTAQKEEKRGIVTPKIYYFDNKKIIWAAGTDINRTTGQTIFYGGEDHGQYEIEKEVAVAPAILLVKKKVLEKVKKFDTTYFATYEDTDFCFSAKKVGFSTYYTPHAVAYHKIPYDPQIAMKRLLERSYWVGRNRYLFLRKFGLFNAVSLLFIPIYILYYWLLAVQYRNYRAIGAYAKGVLAGLTTKV